MKSFFQYSDKCLGIKYVKIDIKLFLKELNSKIF